MRYFLIFFLFSTIIYADQGLNISCVNMKNLLDKNPIIHKFKFDVVTFQYFDQSKNSYVTVPNNKMIIKKDFFAARFPEYELGFQINVFKDDKKPIMSMSKYDYINDKFLEHYICDVQPGYIN